MIMTDILRQYPEWMPIETAPRDGTVVKLKLGDDQEFIGHYFSEFTEGWETEKGTRLNPTQWMPLPEAPK